MRRWLRTSAAQNTVEYLLVLGTLVVALALAFLTFDVVVAQIVGLACPGIDTANGAAAIGTCITSAGS